MFSVYLSNHPDTNGMITFGGFDTSKFAKKGKTDKDIFWGNIQLSEKFWTMPMSNISLSSKNGTTKHLTDADSRNVILDTGVSYAIIPTKDFMAIETALKGYGVLCIEPKESSLVSTYSCSCDSYESIPDI